MPTQEQFNKEAAQSADSRKQLRESRRAGREVKTAMRSQLQGASSTKERREIKSQFGNIYDLSTNAYTPKPENPQTGRRNLQDDGIDFVSRDRAEVEGDGGGGESIDVVWCVNGAPYSGTVVGTIGDPL